MATTDGTTPGRRVTSKDVARHAGVSQSVVSFYLTGARPVSGAARQRIRTAIDELGFRPNRLAQSLRTSKSGQVAVAVPFISNPIYGSFAAAAQVTLAEAGYLTVMMSTLDVPGQADDYFDMVADSGVDGMILFPFPAQARQIAAVRDQGLPLVFADRRLRLPGTGAIDAVVVDNEDGARAAIAHLIGLGHRRIGMVTPVEPTYGEPRVRGYLTAHREAGLEADESLIVRLDGSIEAGYEAARNLLRVTPPITALFATTNMNTLGALEAVREAGRQVNRDFGFVGYDSDNSMLRLPRSIATIRYPATELGQRCAALLLERLTEKPTDRARTITLAPTLELGDTAG